MQRLSGSTRRSEGSRVRNIRDVQKRKAWLKKQIARLQKEGGGSRSSGVRKTQLSKYRKELSSLGGQGNLPTTTRSGGSHQKGMSNLGSNYKKEEQAATKDVKKWRKTDEYKENVTKHNENLKVKSSNTKNNNNKSSDSSSKKDNKEKLKSGKMHAIERKNREIHGGAAVDRLKQKHKEWKKARKEGKLDEWRKKWKKK